MAGLKTYRAKRDFDKTAEPRGKAQSKNSFRYVIQKHAATRLHYDLRLELDGVMMSWAVTRGPSLVSGDKRLSIHVEDHPVQYNSFEGTIPKGEYGGGTVMIWDRGTWTPEFDAHKGMKKGHLEFSLDGEKLHGRWHLVRLKARPGERQEPWLLIKADDEHARTKSQRDILVESPNSVESGRSIEEITAGKSKVWHSNKPATEQSTKLIAAKDKPDLEVPASMAADLVKAKTSKAQAKPSAARKAKAKKVAGKTPAKRATNRPPPQRKAAAQASPAVRSASKAPSTAQNKARALILSGIPGSKKAKLPDFVKPCLATLSPKAPTASDWVHEIKFDGYRIQARIDGGQVTLSTRTGLDWTGRFPTIARACANLASCAVLDGEIVSGNSSGVSDFSALQDDLKSGRHDRLAYYVFDLLHADGYDLTGAPLLERKEQLDQMFGDRQKDGVVRLSEHFETDGPTLLKHACGMGLEGVLSKQADAPYRSGRSAGWLKTKCTNSQELIVAGYEPSDKSARAIRSLLLAYYDKGELRYAGRVGTGWGDVLERDLSKRLKALAADASPFATIPAEERRRNVKWVKPTLVAEIEFRGWTGGTLLRQASFKGVREDKPAKQVVRETARPTAVAEAKRPRHAAARKVAVKKQAAPRKQSIAKTESKVKPHATTKPEKAGKKNVTVAGVRLTNPDRLYWDEASLTKADLATYYEAVWDWMAPQVTGRVLSLVRCPDGQTGQCFYQKHASAGVDQTRLHLVTEPDGGKSISVDNLGGLVALAQAGVLEVHVRGSRIEHLEKADRLVFDLDPGPGIEWPDIIAAARDVRARLQAMKLESFVKTTGGKGLHVVLPIRATPWGEAKAFCHGFAEQMAADEPKLYTALIKKAARGNRIFIDYLRNSREATAVAPFSTRARPGATVSVPLTWAELGKQKAPNLFTIENLPARLSRLRNDPWDGIGKMKQVLPKV